MQLSNKIIDNFFYNLIYFSDAPPKAVFCIFRKEEENGTCQYRFNYEVQPNWTVLLRAYPNPTCSTLMQAAMFSLFIPAVVVLIVGILSVCIWKMNELRRERMEFKQHEANQALHMKMMGDQQENPLYKNPISTFQMPADFNRKREE